MSLAEIQEAPSRSLILLAGPPGAGKSTFCHQVVLNGLAMDRPVIFVTTEQSPSEIMGLLRERGMGELAPAALSFVDAFGDTVGLATPGRSDTIGANCEDLNSISMAIAKLQQRIGKRDIVLAFDSLTSPYLFNREEMFRFMRLCLLKFAAEGNSVLALMDEGCGKEEDLVAMMSVADGIIRMEIKESSRVVNVVKHPKVEPTKIEVPMTRSPTIAYRFHEEMVKQHMEKAEARTEVGDYVNLFWPNFARWSAMLLDPERFPTMIYDLNKQMLGSEIREVMGFYPWHMRLLLKFMLPRNFNKVKNMKKLTSWMQRSLEGDRIGIMEYLEDVSRTDEHYLRVYENDTCWGFENVGATLGLMDGGRSVGALIGLEKEDRDWNVVETKCIGLGDPYCEFKVVPGEIDGLKDSLEALDSTILERIHDCLMDRLMGFMLHGKPLWERPRLGNEISLHEFSHIMVLPAIASEKYRMAMRLGGAMAGKEVGEHLMEAGVMGDEAIRRVIDFMEYCKVGKVTLGETIRIRENCESFGLETGEPSCFFTTGFLNGFFSAVKNQHVREIKCIAAGDPYCEWEFR